MIEANMKCWGLQQMLLRPGTMIEALKEQWEIFSLAPPPDDGVVGVCVCVQWKFGHDNHEAQNSILQAGKDSSCMTTVLLEARTMMFKSCCLSWVCWYHSRVTSVSWVGITVTWGQTQEDKRRWNIVISE